ncbi:hypothetical protein GCM10009609_08610 [Pseudonocardia aurantiaca]
MRRPEITGLGPDIIGFAASWAVAVMGLLGGLGTGWLVTTGRKLITVRGRG